MSKAPTKATKKRFDVKLVRSIDDASVKTLSCRIKKLGQDGFTLIELIVTVFILALVTALVLPMLATSVDKTQRAQTYGNFLTSYYASTSLRSFQAPMGEHRADGMSDNCSAADGDVTPGQPAGGSAQKPYEPYRWTARTYNLQTCTNEASLLQDQLVIKKVELREGDQPDGALLGNFYYPLFLPGSVS